MNITEKILHSKHTLLIQPHFHKPQKSRNHSMFCPLPLLKFATFCRDHHKKYHLIEFKRGNDKIRSEDVDLILVTTSFTYYSRQVRDCVQYYKKLYPHAELICGGVYATLLPKHCKEYTGCDEVVVGVVGEVENLIPAYDLVTTDYQILHTSRGCIRNCNFCATYNIEPRYSAKKSIRREVVKKKLIFYDNNLLSNPHVDNILNELIRLRKHKKIRYCEAQSGIDARLLTQEIADKLYKAGFKNIQFAWDGYYKEKEDIHEAIHKLHKAGYRVHEIKVFILYNYHIPYTECEKKRAYLSRCGVQVTPCRYIPPYATNDGYNPYKKQQERTEYYIHVEWTDKQIRQFKRNCRQHNICKRFHQPYWTRAIEKKKIPILEVEKILQLTEDKAEQQGIFNPNKEQTI